MGLRSKLGGFVNLVEMLAVEISEIVESDREIGVEVQDSLVGVAGSGIVCEAFLDNTDLEERRGGIGHPGDEAIELVQGLLSFVGSHVHLGEHHVRGLKVRSNFDCLKQSSLGLRVVFLGKVNLGQEELQFGDCGAALNLLLDAV